MGAISAHQLTSTTDSDYIWPKRTFQIKFYGINFNFTHVINWPCLQFTCSQCFLVFTVVYAKYRQHVNSKHGQLITSAILIIASSFVGHIYFRFRVVFSEYGCSALVLKQPYISTGPRVRCGWWSKHFTTAMFVAHWTHCNRQMMHLQTTVALSTDVLFERNVPLYGCPPTNKNIDVNYGHGDGLTSPSGAWRVVFSDWFFAPESIKYIVKGSHQVIICGAVTAHRFLIPVLSGCRMLQRMLKAWLLPRHHYNYYE